MFLSSKSSIDLRRFFKIRATIRTVAGATGSTRGSLFSGASLSFLVKFVPCRFWNRRESELDGVQVFWRDALFNIGEDESHQSDYCVTEMGNARKDSMAKNSWIIYALVAVSVFIIDQVTKFFVMARVPVGSLVDVIPHFFRIISVRNTGIVFGLFSQGPARTTQTMFIVFTIAAMATILLYSHRKRSASTPEFYALALILGGALGNLLDRILHGRVVDFLDFYIRGYHWYTFNIADSGIVTGVFLLLIIQWIEGRKQNNEETAGN